MLLIIFLALSFILWSHLFSIQSYSIAVDNSLLMKFAALWAISIYSIIISLYNVKSNYFICIFALFTLVSLCSFFVLIKRIILFKNVLQFKTINSTSEKTLARIQQFYYISRSKSKDDVIQIRKFYLMHANYCID